MRRRLRRAFNAPIARIDADYPRDFSGQGRAVSDARAQALSPIRVEPIDLAPGRRVFLVSPTCMLRPVTPLLAYLEQADLTGKAVALVTTGNSRFEQAATDAFANRVGAHGGRLAHFLAAPRPHLLADESRAAPEGYPSGAGKRVHELVGVEADLEDLALVLDRHLPFFCERLRDRRAAARVQARINREVRLPR